MGHLMAVKDKERQATSDEMFEPLKETIDLLRTYKQEVSDDVHVQLQARSSILVQHHKIYYLVYFYYLFASIIFKDILL